MSPNWDDLKPAAPNWDDLKPADHGLGDLREKAISALPESMRDVARKALSGVAPDWQHNPSSYSPYKPAQPGNMPNDAINPVGTDTQMVGATAAAGLGPLAARALPEAAPNLPRVTMSNMPTQAATPGAGALPIGPPSLPAAASPVQAAGDAAQTSLLKQVGGSVGYGLAHNAADILPFPLNTAAHMALRHPKVLGLF